MHQRPPIIVWFRQDLRILDNPALAEASKVAPILPIYILDDVNAGEFKMGGASRFWLHQSLKALNESCQGNLCLYQGDPLTVLQEIIQRTGATGVYWNRCYEPWRIKRDQHIKTYLATNQIDCKSFNASLLWEPWEVLKQDKTPYRVFTPFFKKGCLETPSPRFPIKQQQNITWVKDTASHLLDELSLLPKISWHQSLQAHWQPGEVGAHLRLNEFLEKGIRGYQEGRNFPSQPHVSKLSPHLRFGEISPNTVWYAVQNMDIPQYDKDHFLSELGWREFSYHLLYHNPSMPVENLQKKFDAFPWQHDEEVLQRWQQGKTGYPIVDAGMRELWQTGYMHNRVRMIVASFLVKNLMIHWRHGAQWFWDCLVDADLANNSASWQWVAGCGADAAPFFRIFNPVMQAEKFDPEGNYIKKFVPELKYVPIPYVYAPWKAPKDVLNRLNMKLGENYFSPMVDLEKSRNSALLNLNLIKI